MSLVAGSTVQLSSSRRVAERRMRRWAKRAGENVPAIQAFASILTVFLAIGALLGVKVQIDASARLQQEQSARDIYREFLNLSISRPEFSEPDYCALINGPQASAYADYVDYFLYTSEQMLASDENWKPSLVDRLQLHRDYVCSIEDTLVYSDEVHQMINDFKKKQCAGNKAPCAALAR